MIASVGVFWWRRGQGNSDEWGDWEPVALVSPDPAEPAPESIAT